MKRSIYTFFLTLITLTAFTQTSYKITSNGSWSSSIPTTCINCAITISDNVTLTVDQSTTCMNCTFQGGTILVPGKSFTLLYSGSQTTTYFTGTTVNVTGNNGQITVNAPLSLTNSTFTFNNNATFTTSYEVDLTASTINLYDNSSMTSTGGANTPINLMSNSHINIGNGSQVSNATLLISGPALNIYDKSTVAIGNQNNSYFNWSSYTYYPNVNANSHASKSYSTLNTTMNCGTGYAHTCNMASVYGPATLANSGAVSATTLPIVLDAFTATLNSDKTIGLDWNTQQESNSSHINIQRSADGENWENIGTVQAKGNSATATEYNYTDEHPVSGNNFYRLQLVDLDNSFTYSDVKVVRTSAIGTVSFFPNPARDYVNVSLGSAVNATETVTVRLISMSGQVMQEQQTAAAAGTVVSFRVSNYASGIYILSVTGQNGTHETRELMISRM